MWWTKSASAVLRPPSMYIYIYIELLGSHTIYSPNYMETDFLYIRIRFFQSFFFFCIFFLFFFLGPFMGPEKSRLGGENLSRDKFSWKSEPNLMIS